MRNITSLISPLRTLSALFGLLLLLHHPAHADCQLQQRTSVPLTEVNGRIIVPVTLNGITVAFLLDTGAQRSLVTATTAAQLNLARDEWVGTTLSGIGGINTRPNADPRSFSLGGLALVRPTLNHDTSLTVGDLPRLAADAPVIDGLLGRDYLSVYDLDLDLPDHRLTLYQPTGCSGRFLPWQGNYTSMPVSIPTGHALQLPVQLNGISLRALLDTGTTSSLVGAAGLFRLGLQPASLDADQTATVSGIGPRSVTMRRHRFETLQVSGQIIDHPLIWVAPIRLSPIVDMLLGADWMAGRRVWISYATRQLFLANP